MRLSHVLSALLLVPASAGAYTLSDNKWNVDNGPVEYFIATAGTPDITDDSHLNAIQNAFHSWECVLCSRIQFRYMGLGPNGVAQDGKNTVMWVSNAATLQQLVGASDTFFSVSINFDPMAKPFFEQDIIFNDHAFQGKDVIWTTTSPLPPDTAGPDGGPAIDIHLDVESIMLREVGIFMGLKDNCDETGMNCRPLSETVMTNTYGGINRTLRQDDMDGVCALYPGSKTSCELRRQFETCERDCDCDTGLVCVPDGTARMCSAVCNISTGICPNRSGCVLIPGQNDGLCLRAADGNKKLLGMSCVRDSECQVNNCTQATALNRSVCTQACTAPSDCTDGYTCVEGTCLLPAGGDTIPCASPDAGSTGSSGDGGSKKGCSHSSTGSGVAFVGLAFLVMALRRR